LPQNKFENILRKEVLQNESTAELLFGYEAKDIISSLNGTRVLLKRSNYGKAEARGNSKDDDVIELNCVYLLAADGANSLARQSLGIPLVGEECIQTLLNVHFTCYGLRDLLKPRPAMLYFVFNESMVAVFVAHDPLKDEWVCQIPIFPPFRTPVVGQIFTVKIAHTNMLPSFKISSGTDKCNRNSNLRIFYVTGI
jgi:2-polyprenyl-6-methoxyphenol hydroxylase-like FAD-dependent oxidoreductase